MKKALLVLLATGAALTAFSSANAAGGCGRGFHPGPYGHCRPNGGPGRVIVAPGLVVGNYYNGRGYWDGNRYWHNRYHDHGGWRYR